jgi:hypothetical protein
VDDLIQTRANLWCISKIKGDDTLGNQFTERYENRGRCRVRSTEERILEESDLC